VFCERLIVYYTVCFEHSIIISVRWFTVSDYPFVIFNISPKYVSFFNSKIPSNQIFLRILRTYNDDDVKRLFANFKDRGPLIVSATRLTHKSIQYALFPYFTDKSTRVITCRWVSYLVYWIVHCVLG
jgi:hypothetical protein